jgi:hypothetical protein
MSKIKIGLFSVLATVALSAAMSSSALAAHEFRVNGTAVGATAFEVQGSSQEGWFETTTAGNQLVLNCQADYTSVEKESNLLEKEGKSKAKLEFRNCFVYKLETTGKKVALGECHVTEPVVAEATDKLENVGEDKFTGTKAEETFAEIVLPKSETCSLTKTAAITLKAKGAEVCTVPLAQEEDVVHELFCTPGGSTLKSGTEPARFWSTELLKLVKAEPWSAT